MMESHRIFPTTAPVSAPNVGSALGEELGDPASCWAMRSGPAWTGNTLFVCC
jgi:hypothetical protein